MPNYDTPLSNATNAKPTIEWDVSDAYRVHAVYQGMRLFTYTVKPDFPPVEFNRPYLHPIHTLAGDVVTNDRPNDHAWHKGLSMTLTVVNNENFWGGKTYVQGEGYLPKNNVGQTIHREWLKQEGGDSAVLAHQLDWLTAQGERWLTEERTLHAEVLANLNCWSLTWQSRLENVSGKVLKIGSPTTKGREASGYGGLFWRGARDLHGGQVIADGSLNGEDAVNGGRGRWVAYRGMHDGSQRTSTILFRDHPDNPRYPTPWFVRTTQYAGVCPNFAYNDVYVLKRREVLDLRYRLFIINDMWTPEEINQVVSVML